MKLSEALWEVFKSTGHIGAYLIYKDYASVEAETISAEINGSLEGVQEGLEF